MLLTVFSWYLLCIWYGWGYCFCTDWHWKVRERLGYYDHSSSYIHFLVYKITNIDFNEDLVITVTISIFFICLFLSVLFNTIDLIRYIRRRIQKTEHRIQM